MCLHFKEGHKHFSNEVWNMEISETVFRQMKGEGMFDQEGFKYLLLSGLQKLEEIEGIGMWRLAGGAR